MLDEIHQLLQPVITEFEELHNQTLESLETIEKLKEENAVLRQSLQFAFTEADKLKEMIVKLEKINEQIEELRKTRRAK